MSAAGTLTLWTGLACLGGTEAATLRSFRGTDSASAPRVKRQRWGGDLLTFALDLRDPNADLLVPQAPVRLTWPDGTWEEWRIEAEDTTDAAADGERSFRAKPILFDLHDFALCFDVTGADPELLTGGMAAATVAEFWDTIVAPSLAIFGVTHVDLGTVDEPTRPYDFAYDGQSPYAAILAAVSAATGGRKRLRVRANGTTNYLLDVLSRLDGGAAPLVIQPDQNLRRYQRQWTSERQATVVAVRGASGTGTAQHAFRVTAVTSGTVLTLADPEGAGPPLVLPNQATGLGLRRLLTGRVFAVTASDPTTQRVTLDEAPGAPWVADATRGELVQFAAVAPVAGVLDDDAVGVGAPDPTRTLTLNTRVKDGLGADRPTTGLDWRLGSLNTGAGTATVAASTILATQLSATPTLAASVPAAALPEFGGTPTAELPVDQWLRPLRRITTYGLGTGGQWQIDHVPGTTAYALDGTSFCASDGYCVGTLPVAVQVGDVLMPYDQGAPLNPMNALLVTSIAAGRDTFTATPLSGAERSSIVPRWYQTELWRLQSAWIRVEAFDRSTQVIGFGDGFAAAVTAGAIANGDAFVVARNAPGRSLVAVPDQAAVAAYGPVVRTVDRTTRAGVRNLDPDGLFRDWPSGAVPAGWTTSGLTSRSTDPLFRPLGAAAILVDHAGATTTTTLDSRPLRVWLPATATELSVRLPYYLASPAPGTAPTVTVAVLDRTFGASTALATYSVPAAALQYDVGDHITLSHIPLPTGGAGTATILRDLSVQITLHGLVNARFAVRGLQVTDTGEPPGGPADATVGGLPAPEMIDVSWSNAHWATALAELTDHADPRVTAAAYALAVTDRFRSDRATYPLDALLVDRVVQVTNSRVTAPTVTLEIVSVDMNLRDATDTTVDVGLPPSELTDDLTSGGVSIPSSVL